MTRRGFLSMLARAVAVVPLLALPASIEKAIVGRLSQWQTMTYRVNEKVYIIGEVRYFLAE